MKEKKPRKKLDFSLKMPRQIDRFMHVSLLFLCLFGTLMILSVSVSDAAVDTYGIYKTLIRQLVFLIGGYLVMVILARYFTLKLARKHAFMGMVAALIMLLVTLFFDNGYGIRAWIPIILPFGLPSFTLQPSEFIKLAMIIFLGVYWGNCSNKIEYQLNDVLKLPFIIFGIAAIIIMRQPDFGSFAILCFIFAVMSLLPTHPVFRAYKQFMGTCVIIVCGMAYFLMTPIGIKMVSVMPFMDYQIVRFQLAMNPFTMKIGDGYQLVNGMVAFFTGGWKGVGIGNSTHKFGYIPAAKTDSILPIIVEETGVIGFAAIMIAYTILIVQMFRYAFRIRNTCARMILVGISSYLFIHFVLNVGGVTGLIPMTGIPLLFISSGGSSMLTGMAAVGVAQAIIGGFKRGEIE